MFPSVDEPGIQEMWIPLTSFGHLKAGCLGWGFRSCCSQSK